VKELGGDATNFRIVDAMTWRGNIGAPGPGATVDALLSAVANTPAGNTAALRTALTEVITAVPSSAPTSDRVADPTLIESLSGGSATYGQIEAGQFRVHLPPDASPWWVVLDVAPADIKLVVR
ncbi:MAG: hypothetical protein M3Z66_12840, partial [Chloroflexota bacterium]|nr:hypothetical protein [Chloroflexota bacterium]